MRTFSPPSFSFIPPGLHIPSSEGRRLFYCDEFRDGADWKAGQRLQGGRESVKLEKFHGDASANIYTCTLAPFSCYGASNLQQGPSGRGQLDGDEIQTQT